MALFGYILHSGFLGDISEWQSVTWARIQEKGGNGDINFSFI